MFAGAFEEENGILPLRVAYRLLKSKAPPLGDRLSSRCRLNRECGDMQAIRVAITAMES